MTKEKTNPLGVAPISKLMIKFAVPSIIAMLVSALYNIVDQLFIGQAVGTLGNAATNVAFPLSISCTAIGLLFGIGGASCFNLAMGRRQIEKAGAYIGNSATMLFICGLILCLLSQLFLVPLLRVCGAPDDVLPYAQTYVRITSIGFPFLILTTGGGHLIRADGSPRMTMICSLSGAVINTILDAVFVLVFEWGMAGAAIATIIGQIFSGCLVIWYLNHYRTVILTVEHFRIRWGVVFEVALIGLGSFVNQLAMMVVQIVLNNSLKYYGASSLYGEAIPLACAGIVMKVNQVFFSVVIGIAQGTQPIESFNYGAKQYDRVKQSYFMAMKAGGVISFLSFILFQTIPRQIISLFGSGSDLYYQFGVSFFRGYLFFTWLNFMQPITATFFTSIGKPSKGIFLSLTRQILFLLPLLVTLPMIFGIDGILFAAPAADLCSAIVCVIMSVMEFREMRRLKSEVQI